MCGDDIFTVVANWLERDYFPSSLKDTNICLIPKCKSHSTMKDLRPISLCNVMYEMVLKLMENWLKGCLSKCMLEEQSVFVEGSLFLTILL